MKGSKWAPKQAGSEAPEGYDPFARLATTFGSTSSPKVASRSNAVPVKSPISQAAPPVTMLVSQLAPSDSCVSPVMPVKRKENLRLVTSTPVVEPSQQVPENEETPKATSKVKKSSLITARPLERVSKRPLLENPSPAASLRPTAQKIVSIHGPDQLRPVSSQEPGQAQKQGEAPSSVTTSISPDEEEDDLARMMAKLELERKTLQAQMVAKQEAKKLQQAEKSRADASDRADSVINMPTSRVSPPSAITPVIQQEVTPIATIERSLASTTRPAESQVKNHAVPAPATSRSGPMSLTSPSLPVPKPIQKPSTKSESPVPKAVQTPPTPPGFPVPKFDPNIFHNFVRPAAKVSTTSTNVNQNDHSKRMMTERAIEDKKREAKRQQEHDKIAHAWTTNAPNFVAAGPEASNLAFGKSIVSSSSEGTNTMKTAQSDTVSYVSARDKLHAQPNVASDGKKAESCFSFSVPERRGSITPPAPKPVPCESKVALSVNTFAPEREKKSQPLAELTNRPPTVKKTDENKFEKPVSQRTEPIPKVPAKIISNVETAQSEPKASKTNTLPFDKLAYTLRSSSLVGENHPSRFKGPSQDPLASSHAAMSQIDRTNVQTQDELVFNAWPQPKERPASRCCSLCVDDTR